MHAHCIWANTQEVCMKNPFKPTLGQQLVSILLASRLATLPSHILLPSSSLAHSTGQLLAKSQPPILSNRLPVPQPMPMHPQEQHRVVPRHPIDGLAPFRGRGEARGI